MKCAGEDNVFVCAELLQPLRKITLVDQTTSLIDNKKRKDNPILIVSIACLYHPMLPKGGGGVLHSSDLTDSSGPLTLRTYD